MYRREQDTFPNSIHPNAICPVQFALSDTFPIRLLPHVNCTPDDYCPMRRVPSKIFSPDDIFPGFVNEDLCPTQSDDHSFVINRLRFLSKLAAYSY